MQLRRRDLMSDIERSERENAELRRARARDDDISSETQTHTDALTRHCELLAKQNDELA